MRQYEGQFLMSLEMSVPNNVAPEFCDDIPRLLGFFEALGENCDLGVVQRAVGIEPFGLFRFAACKDTELVELLRMRFHPLGEPEDLWLDEQAGPSREYWVKSRHCSFSAHSDRYAGRDDPEVVRAGEIEKTRYLKTKLIRDLSQADGCSCSRASLILQRFGRLSQSCRDTVLTASFGSASPTMRICRARWSISPKGCCVVSSVASGPMTGVPAFLWKSGLPFAPRPIVSGVMPIHPRRLFTI